MYCEKNTISLVIMLHAERKEVQLKEYEENGKWIIWFANKNGIPIVTDIEVLGIAETFQK